MSFDEDYVFERLYEALISNDSKRQGSSLSCIEKITKNCISNSM